LFSGKSNWLVLTNWSRIAWAVIADWAVFFILHIYLIHVLAMIFAELSGFGWKLFILPTWIGFVPAMKGYGFNLVTVYFVWIGIILALYPLCRKFDHYKQNNKHKWWLSYL